MKKSLLSFALILSTVVGFSAAQAQSLASRGTYTILSDESEETVSFILTKTHGKTRINVSHLDCGFSYDGGFIPVVYDPDFLPYCSGNPGDPCTGRITNSHALMLTTPNKFKHVINDRSFIGSCQAVVSHSGEDVTIETLTLSNGSWSLVDTTLQQ